MGTEAAPFIFGPPFLLGLVLLLTFTFRDSKKAEGPHRFLGLGRRRLAKGYLAALGVLFLLCAWIALLEGQTSIFFYYFVVFSVLLMALITAIVLPLLALLRHAHLASVLSISLGGVGVAAILGALIGGQLFISALVGAILAAAFSIAAGLPFIRGSRHVA